MSTAVYVMMLDALLVEMAVFEHFHKNNWSFFMLTSMKATCAICLKRQKCIICLVCTVPRRFGLFVMWSVWNSVSATPSPRNGVGGHMLNCSGLCCSIDSWKVVPGFVFSKSVTHQHLWKHGTEFSYVTCILFTSDEISQGIEVHENDIPFHCTVLNDNWRMYKNKCCRSFEIVIEWL
jgi:hypothetical protein